MAAPNQGQAIRQGSNPASQMAPWQNPANSGGGSSAQNAPQLAQAAGVSQSNDPGGVTPSAPLSGTSAPMPATVSPLAQSGLSQSNDPAGMASAAAPAPALPSGGTGPAAGPGSTAAFYGRQQQPYGGNEPPPGWTGAQDSERRTDKQAGRGQQEQGVRQPRVGFRPGAMNGNPGQPATPTSAGPVSAGAPTPATAPQAPLKVIGRPQPRPGTPPLY